jgi:hypothetical protein
MRSSVLPGGIFLLSQLEDTSDDARSMSSAGSTVVQASIGTVKEKATPTRMEARERVDMVIVRERRSQRWRSRTKTDA